MVANPDSSQPQSCLPPEIVAEINKRMTMNMLIQGSAWQACLTVHHLIKDELDELDPFASKSISNTEFYDRFSICVLMSQWNSELAFFTGLSSHFWSLVGTGRTAFCNHPLLSRHGKTLADTSKEKTIERCREKGVWSQPVALSFHAASLLLKAIKFENHHHFLLISLAKQATADAWGIDQSMFRADITEFPEFGDIRVPGTEMGKQLRKLMVGWGGVENENGELVVVGRSKYWSLLLHELCKGTMELICLHGLNELEDDTYSIVMEKADQIEFEVWMMQSGLELYRKLLNLLPREIPIAESIMHIATMPAEFHEKFTMAVIENRSRAISMFCDYAGVDESTVPDCD